MAIQYSELQSLLDLSRATGNPLIIGLEDGPIVVLPVERYQELVLRQDVVAPVRQKQDRVERRTPQQSVRAPQRQRVVADEYLVEPLE